MAERLNRFLARRGVASRRGADALIAAGHVSVNGVVAHLGTTVDSEHDAVAVDGTRVSGAAIPPQTYVLNKPPGFVTTRRDPQHRRTVMELVPRVAGLVPVGRLDVDTRGLLLLTTDGELAHRLTHPGFGIEKTYRATVAPPLDSDAVARLLEGVDLEDGPARALAARPVEHVSAGVLEIVMGEGRKREVRRLIAAVGGDVRDLIRVAEGPVQLGALREGSSRLLTHAEARALYAAVELSLPGAGT